MAKPWTDKEKQIIIDMYPELGPHGCVSMLPGRDAIAIRDKARKMRVRMSDEAKSKLRSQQVYAPRNPGGYRKPEPKEVKVEQPEYLQASDIFQVGFRFARSLGVLSTYMQEAA